MAQDEPDGQPPSFSHSGNASARRRSRSAVATDVVRIRDHLTVRVRIDASTVSLRAQMTLTRSLPSSSSPSEVCAR